MARGVARRDRHDGHADALGALVKAEPAREEPVAEGHVEHVAAARPGRRQHARHHLAPDLEVTRCVADDGRLAFRPRRGVDAGDFGELHREEAERVRVAQLALPDERQPCQVLEVSDLDAAQPLAVEAHALDRPAERLAQPLPLQLPPRLPRHRLGVGIPDHERRGVSWVRFIPPRST